MSSLQWEPKMRQVLLSMLTLASAFIISCGGSGADDCAFQAQDGSCAATVSTTGALVCELDDAALCDTMTAFIEGGEPSVASSSAALVSTGRRIGGGQLSVVCEPEGTFMCNCCSIQAGCYPCPKKVATSIFMSSRVSDSPEPELSVERAEVTTE